MFICVPAKVKPLRCFPPTIGTSNSPSSSRRSHGAMDLKPWSFNVWCASGIVFLLLGDPLTVSVSTMVPFTFLNVFFFFFFFFFFLNNKKIEVERKLFYLFQLIFLFSIINHFLGFSNNSHIFFSMSNKWSSNVTTI